MKIQLKHLLTVVLFCTLSATILTSCSSNDEPMNVDMVDITADATVAEFSQFLNDACRYSWYSPFFDELDGDCMTSDTADKCYVINSRKEFDDIYKGEETAPYLDFSKYTLIIGQVEIPYSGYRLKDLVLQKKGGSYKLTVYIENLGGGFCAISSIRYWEIYPKLDHKKVDVEAVFSNVWETIAQE